jgi:glycosyltransferase involved in cell wall biosynthesis
MMSREQPLVSVIIPCYNVSAFIQKAIQSIIDQTYTNLEIWIVDDASTDDTLQKIKAFKDDRIKVLEFKNNTQKIGAVNEVLQKVNGEFIAFQDADDWSEPDRIEQQLKYFESEPGLGVCFTNYRYVGYKMELPGKIALTNEDLKDEFLQFGNKKNKELSPTVCGSMMISKAALQKTGGYHPYFAGRVAEDIHWIYRILKDFKGNTIDKVLYNYRTRQGSLTDVSFSGTNAKYAYSCQLLSRIIYKDIHESFDVLNPANKVELARLELEACEEKLNDTLKLLNDTRKIYENSFSFKLGKFILKPWQLFKSIKN